MGNTSFSYVALLMSTCVLATGCESNTVNGYFAGMPSSAGTSSSTTSSIGPNTPSSNPSDTPVGLPSTSASITPPPPPPVTVASASPSPSATATTPVSPTNPTQTISPSPSPTPSPSVSVSPSPSASPSPTPSPTPTPSGPCTETCNIENGVGVQSCGSTGTEQSSCILTQCNPGYVADNGACVPTHTVTSFQCTSYELLVLNSDNELVTATESIIPAQDPSGKGVCYYYPINEETLSGSSSLTGSAVADHDQDVISRDHDVNSGNPLYVWHPYIMKHFNADLTIAGPRQLNITGGSVSGTNFTTSDVEIDNFFLVGAYPQSADLSPANLLSYYSAWGTSDSTVNGGPNNSLTGIAFNPAGLPLTTNAVSTYSTGTTPYSDVGIKTSADYAVIPLNAEASGGTANVPEVSLTNYITPNVSTTVDFRGLDCGSDRALNNIYLLVQ
jgi:hypothetical protein